MLVTDATRHAMLARHVITHSQAGDSMGRIRAAMGLVICGFKYGDYVRNRRGEFLACGACCPRHGAISYILLIKYLGRKGVSVPKGLPPPPSHDLVIVASGVAPTIERASSRTRWALTAPTARWGRLRIELM